MKKLILIITFRWVIPVMIVGCIVLLPDIAGNTTPDTINTSFFSRLLYAVILSQPFIDISFVFTKLRKKEETRLEILFIIGDKNTIIERLLGRITHSLITGGVLWIALNSLYSQLGGIKFIVIAFYWLVIIIIYWNLDIYKNILKNDI